MNAGDCDTLGTFQNTFPALNSFEVLPNKGLKTKDEGLQHFREPGAQATSLSVFYPPVFF